VTGYAGDLEIFRYGGGKAGGVQSFLALAFYFLRVQKVGDKQAGKGCSSIS